MRYCFDIDGTLCTQNCGGYENALPYYDRIEVVNRLKAAGHTILLYTARGSRTGFDQRYNTRRQLEEWGVQYDELIMGKPDADVFVDDKAITADLWFDVFVKKASELCHQLQQLLTTENQNEHRDEETNDDRRDAE